MLSLSLSVLVLPDSVRREGMPTGFRDLKLVPDDACVASESRSESESDPDILETFPENLRMNNHNMGLDGRKFVFGVREKQRNKPVCASVQSDQLFCYSLIRKYQI